MFFSTWIMTFFVNANFSSKFESKKSISIEFQRFVERDFINVNYSRIVFNENIKTWENMIVVVVTIFVAIVTLNIFCKFCLMIRFILEIFSLIVFFFWSSKFLLILINRWIMLLSFFLIFKLFLNFFAFFLYTLRKCFEEIWTFMKFFLWNVKQKWEW